MKASKNLYVRLSRAIGSIILVFILSNILLVEETKAGLDCQALGYNQTSVSMTVGGCDLIADVCYLCPPTGISGGSFILANLKFQPTDCIPIIPINEVIEEIYNQLYSFYYINIICPNPIPPCDEFDRKEIEVKVPICWKIVNEQGEYLYVPCEDTAYCKYIIKLCRDVLYGKLISEFVDLQIEGIINCAVPFPSGIDLENEINSLNPGEESDCFYINTKCK